MSRTKTDEPIEVAFLAWSMDSGGSKEPCIGGGPDPPSWDGTIWGEILRSIAK